jgi:molybdopterin molybdotransferase
MPTPAPGTRRQVVSFEQALATVEARLLGAKADPPPETLPLDQVRGRILAEDITADRDYPPFHRATRDGYAVRSADVAIVPATLICRGQVRAGESFPGTLVPGECVEIMTGAPLPAGADAVVMVEQTQATGSSIEVRRAVGPWDNVVRQGSEARAGSRVLARGRRLGPGEMGLLASLGRAQVRVFRAPRVAILPTGDELVAIDAQPEWFQIRNSNAVTLAAQVAAAGGVPRRLTVAPDRKDDLSRLIREGLESDLLVLTGGVSMGKYDLVAEVLDELGAEFFLQGVALRPGKPFVFGRVAQKFFFGLPGNPVSTYVTFELFVRPALGALGGGNFEPHVFFRARLGSAVRLKLGLTAFFPARVAVQQGDPVVNLVGWQGSGDLVGVAAANCFLVIHPQQTDLAPGDWVDVLPKGQ